MPKFLKVLLKKSAFYHFLLNGLTYAPKLDIFFLKMGMENTLDTIILHPTIISGSYGSSFASQLCLSFCIRKTINHFSQKGG